MCERISVFIRRLSLNAEHSNIVVAHRNAKSTYLKSCLRVCSRQNDNCQFKYIPHKKQRSVKRKLIGKLTVDARFYLFGCSKIFNCFIKLHHILNVWIFASFFQLRNRWRSVLPHWVIRNELITGLENLWILLSDISVLSMIVCSLSPHLGGSKTCKTLEQNSSFKSAL